MAEIEWDFVLKLTERLCDIGKSSRDLPPVSRIEPFKCYFSDASELLRNELDTPDGESTRREILARYLLLSVVLDQGPDIPGVRQLLKEVTEELYSLGIRLFHRPADYFGRLDISIDSIQRHHESVKAARADVWARANRSTPARYNLLFAQSPRGIISTHQVLDYAIHRWGVPLCVPLLLEMDAAAAGRVSGAPLVEYLESHKSAEVMANQLKAQERYGLGSAIGDKACHLFAKMYVSVLRLVGGRSDDEGWDGISFEVPFDSNAGRVLLRTGFLLEFASLEDYQGWNVIQEGRGKGGTDYVRVTNIRGRRTDRIHRGSAIFSKYLDVVANHLRTGSRPRSVAIQHIPNLCVYKLVEEGPGFSVADFDDGLIHVGTTFCLNRPDPNCEGCPLRDLCKGHNELGDLISMYTT